MACEDGAVWCGIPKGVWFCRSALDCFAALAMTVGGVGMCYVPL